MGFSAFFCNFAPLLLALIELNCMNVLIATIVLPYPLTSGGAQGVFNMVEELRHKHQITLIFPENAGNSLQAMHQLRLLWPEVDIRPFSYARQMRNPRFVWDKAIRAFNLKFRANNPHFQVARILDHYGYYMSKDFGNFIREIIAEKKPDLVQVEFYQYLKVVDLLPADVKKIFIHHELRFVRNDRFLQPFVLNKKEARLRNFIKDEEVTDLNKYDAVVTVTDVDRQILSETEINVPLYTSTLAISTPPINYKQWNGRLVFVGGISHTPNEEGMLWFLNKVAPLIQWNKPGMASCLDIIGKGWTEEWVQAANISDLKVNLLGFMERLDTAAYGSIMIVPILSGSGMRMKILEGAALGAPIITTTVGVEGIEFAAGEACLVADSPKAFAKSLQRMMQDEQLRCRLTSQARRVYDEKYSRQSLSQKREEIWQQVCALPPTTESDT